LVVLCLPFAGKGCHSEAERSEAEESAFPGVRLEQLVVAGSDFRFLISRRVP
jgi:hypothetical protein